ncbi:hypothetical protein Cgig2_031211 [Carnegiea gigantea]|uniref:Uncharacterized protein n=1 Tax=Carnegiea gigantea TaxID=171969 RepID=A0A9Q1GH89_9CARY|nr:hypothetical protein Cgig2_031211 [Carnegiea gigantea]
MHDTVRQIIRARQALQAAQGESTNSVPASTLYTAYSWRTTWFEEQEQTSSPHGEITRKGCTPEWPFAWEHKCSPSAHDPQDHRRGLPRAGRSKHSLPRADLHRWSSLVVEVERQPVTPVKLSGIGARLEKGMSQVLHTVLGNGDTLGNHPGSKLEVQVLMDGRSSKL